MRSVVETAESEVTAETVVRTSWPVDLRATLGPLRRGATDPSMCFDRDSVWRASRTPEGDATLWLHASGGQVHARAWGPGAHWVVAGVPELIGARDSREGWSPPHQLIRRLDAHHPGLRVPRSRLVVEALVPGVLEQKVTGTEARRSWRDLLWRYGEPAPGPAPVVGGRPRPLRVMPSVDRLVRLPSWDWHRLGVERRRAEVIAGGARHARRMEECVGMTPDAAAARLRALPGVGVWTAAEVAQRALGDADAVSVGDYHLSKLVGWALVGEPVDDDGMLELLKSYAGQRYRAVRLIELSGLRPPRRGPRQQLRAFRSF